jgi:hypothetical protein
MHDIHWRATGLWLATNCAHKLLHHSPRRHHQSTTLGRISIHPPSASLVSDRQWAVGAIEAKCLCGPLDDQVELSDRH